jgi:hypothetical protein
MKTRTKRIVLSVSLKIAALGLLAQTVVVTTPGVV